MSLFFNALFNGISVGSVLLIVALGLAIVFGLMGAINLAHGELMMLGAYTTFVVQNVMKPLGELDVDTYHSVFDVNVRASMEVVQAAAVHMTDGGRIVAVSATIANHFFAPALGLYGASKAAGAHLHAIWAEELAEHGVRIVTVDPGEMNTQMHADAMPDADPNRLASPEDIADRLFARWASSEAGRWELQS